MALKWPEGWFANRGQIVQVALGALAFLLACIVAWPSLQANELLSPGSLLYFTIAAFVIFFGVRTVAVVGKPDNRKLKESELPTSPALVYSTTCHVGDYWQEPKELFPLKLYLRRIVTEPVLAVEVALSSTSLSYTYGRQVTKQDDGSFLVPIVEKYPEEDCALFNFSVEEKEASVEIVRVVHANVHTQKVELLVCKFSATAKYS